MIEGLFQPVHLVLILAIIMIVFGAGKLPEMGGAVGRGIREFRKEVQDASGSETETGLAEQERLTRADATDATGSAVFCTSCGERLPDGARFCPACGTTISTAGTPSEVQPATENVEPIEQGNPAL